MNIYAIITLIAAIITAFLSVYALRYRRTRGALSFSGLCFAAAAYAMGYVLELNGTSIEEFRFGLYIEYLGIPFIPFFWIVFTLQITENQKFINWKTIMPLLSISCITLVLNYTNQYHNLYYKDIQLDNSGQFPVALLIKGPWYWVHIAYINVATLLGNVLLVKYLFKASKVYRNQVLIMFFGSLFPWIGHILYQIGLSPEGIDISPVVLSFSGIVYSLGLFYFRILDLVPIALEHVIDSMKGAVIITDLQKRIVNINPSGRKLLNRSHSILIGKKIDNDFNYISEIINKLFESKTEETVYLIDEANKYFQVSITEIKNRRNLKLGYAIVLHDITEQKTIENELRERETELKKINATRDKFFNIIAHDLRSPFNSLLGMSEILKDKLENQEYKELHTITKIIYEASDSGFKLLENLLDWAQVQTNRVSFEPGNVDIVSIVKEGMLYIENIAKEKHIELENNFMEQAIVFADENMIRTILRNLLSNAIKFTNRNGKIIITIQNYDSHNILVSVKDNGIGISKNRLDSLFDLDKIQSTNGTELEKGTGLGLQLCKEFVEMNKGKIWVNSKENVGSEFAFILPSVSHL